MLRCCPDRRIRSSSDGTPREAVVRQAGLHGRPNAAPRPSSSLSPIGGFGCGDHPLSRVRNLECEEQLRTVHRNVLLGLQERHTRTRLEARWLHDVCLQLGLQHCHRNVAAVVSDPTTPSITLTASPRALRRLGGMCAPAASEPPPDAQS